MKSKFVEGTSKKGFDQKTIEKIWTDWEAFAQYAFNKSHSTCYAFVAYQTAYLKSHYPAEYMASVLTHNLGNIDKITFFMEESKRMGIPVLGPDVNESEIQFSVNKAGQIRFGMGAIKGVGEGAAQAIIEERKQNGPYKTVFDLVKRISSKAANKKTFENLVYAGALDSFTDLHRATYFKADGPTSPTFLEKILRYGQQSQESKNSSQGSLFDMADDGSGVEMPAPTIPTVEPWIPLMKLKAEKEIIGIYLSGHPLDDYRVEMKNFCRHTLADLKDLPKMRGHDMSIGGMITTVQHRMTKTGKPFGIFTLEDYNESNEFFLFGDDYMKFKQFILTEGFFVHIRGTVQPRFRDSDQLEFKIQSMELLSEILEKRVKNLTVQLPLPAVNDDLIGRVQQILQRHPGNSGLKFLIFDTASNMHTEVPSRKVRVKPGNELFRELESEIPEVVWKLN
jgi:DNA polymerase-3 subunit alpha